MPGRSRRPGWSGRRSRRPRRTAGFAGPGLLRMGRPRRRPGGSGPAERRYRRRAVHSVLVVHRHECVERIPSRHEIRDPGVGRNLGQRRVCLDEAPVPLRGEMGVYVLPRQGRTVQPWREAPQWIRQIRRLEDEQRANHLHPGRSGFRQGAYHDVAGSETEANPPATVLAAWLTAGLTADRGSGHAVSVARVGATIRARGAVRTGVQRCPCRACCLGRKHRSLLLGLRHEARPSIGGRPLNDW